MSPEVAMSRLLALLLLLACPATLAAQSFEHCNKDQIAYAQAAVDGAIVLSEAAAAAVADTPEYERWFGIYAPDTAEAVRAGLKAVHAAAQLDSVRLVCPPLGEDGCDFGTYANVWPDDPYVINLCYAFFGQPTIAGVVTTSAVFDNGTREGTIIHELSHFTAVAGTEDNCYGREVCTDMAKVQGDLTRDNADSYQYFAEDVVLAREGRLD
jgi:peptidyl-Lys metalloendopeptidase